MWEFLIGTVLVRARLRVLERRPVREAAALAGMVLIAGSILFLDEKQPFPGLLAVPGCLGAALVIAAGEHGDSVVGRLLGWWPARLIGVISYSLYLWHWPVIVFFKELKPTHVWTALRWQVRHGAFALLVGAAMCPTCWCGAWCRWP